MSNLVYSGTNSAFMTDSKAMSTAVGETLIRTLSKKPTFQFRINDTCQRCGRYFVLLFSQVYWCTADWSVLFFIFSSSYWHLLNVFNLAFNIQTLLGMLLAFLIAPGVLFIPVCQNFLQSCFGLFISRIVSISMMACAFQVHESVRTVFLALCSGLVLQRMFTTMRTAESILWPHIHFVNYMLGLVLLICIRQLFGSLHPLDMMDSTTFPALSLATGVVTAIMIFEFTPKWETCPNTETLGLPGPWCLKSGITLALGILGTLGMTSVIFLAAYMLSSDAFIPRFTGFDPVLWGPLVAFCLMLGVLIQILMAVFGHVMDPIWDASIRSIAATLFVTGISLFMTVRKQQGSLSISIPMDGVGTQLIGETIPKAYAGGCLTALTFPLVGDIAAQMFRHYFVSVRSHLRRWVVSLLLGVWMILLYCFQIFWFYRVVDILWNNEPLLILSISFPILVACVVGIIVRFLIRQGSELVLLESSSNFVNVDNSDHTCATQDEKGSEIAEAKCQLILKSVSLSWSRWKSQDSHFASSILVLGSIFVLLFLPSLRHHVYFHTQRGSRLVSDKFSIVTHNIQMGLGLYGKGNIGFPTTDRFLEFDSFIHPHLWALQESDSTNLMNLNRDFLSYFADRGRFFAYPGAPSYISTPGVSFLSSGKLENVTVTVLPSSDEPVNRVVLSGSYPWRQFPTSKPKMWIRVVVVHLSKFSRKAMLLQLEALKQMLPKVGPLVVLGDFNGSPELVEPILLNGTSLKRIDIDSSTGTETAGYEHIDHIYYRDLCLDKCGIAHTVGLSDHLPVWAMFDQPGKNGQCANDNKAGV